MKVLVYDTETTGLPKKSIKHRPTIDESPYYPYIVQFSYIIYDTDVNEIIKIYDNVIKINEDIIISEESIKLHHITREIMDEKGISVLDALTNFIEDFAKVDVIVGHNIQFDNNVAMIEMLRHANKLPANVMDIFLDSHKFYCTMQNSIDLCAIKVFYKNSTKTYNKFPKLIELYTYLFSRTPVNIHNSLNDVVLCLQCFCKMTLSVDIAGLNEKIYNMVENTMVLSC
jgi:DNA polymerase III epsilon subunit-like protein